MNDIGVASAAVESCGDPRKPARLVFPPPKARGLISATYCNLSISNCFLVNEYWEDEVCYKIPRTVRITLDKVWVAPVPEVSEP